MGIVRLEGKGPRVALVDDEDVDRVSSKRWKALKQSKGRGFYAQESGTSLLMHRFILNAPPGSEVDHRNNDGLDNRKENIRLATRRQNACNQVLRPNSAGRGFVARITVHYKRINLGTYPSEVEAAHAFDDAARRFHGEFARLNFPTP